MEAPATEHLCHVCSHPAFGCPALLRCAHSPQACWLQGQHDLLLGRFTTRQPWLPLGPPRQDCAYSPGILSLSRQALGDGLNFTQRVKPRPLSQELTHLWKTDIG